MYKNINVSFISSYLPRQCGIATFTNDLATAVSKLRGDGLDGLEVEITALNNIPEGYKYPSEVKFEIKEQNLNDFKEAANFLNLSKADVINLQHEFGLYGGEDGSNILYLIQNLKKPLVTTLHTILANPTEEQEKIVKELAEASSFLVVQSMRSFVMLEKIYKIPMNKVVYIPHGAHDVPFLDPAYYKDAFQLSDKKVILTFGLLGPGKGMEDVINSLPEVIKEYPNIMYIILGATHPNVKKVYGEEYRDSLENLVTKLGLKNHVMFINRFVDNKRLLEFLLMSDIYISPYHHKEQIVSGTLTYAVACGKAVISTPYWYAEELLQNETGMLVPFKDVKAISETLKQLLCDENKRNRLRKNAYDAGREMIWSKVAAHYCDVFIKAREEYKKSPRTALLKDKITDFPSLPDVNLNHMITMTDSTGIIQHATYSIPNRNEGYCTDDNARALLVAVMNKMLFNNDSVMVLINIYFSFIHHAYNKERGLFRNFMTYDRQWLETAGSEECNGRVFFVLAYIIKNPVSESLLGISKMLYDKAINNTLEFTSCRGIAYVLMSCILYLSHFSGAREVRKICRQLSEKLSSMYNNNKDKEWKWYENQATYNNGMIPQAMIMAGRFLKNKDYVSQGIESLKWLIEVQLDEKQGHISLIGNNGWLSKGKQKAKYDQQPIEIPGLIDACYQAYSVTNDKEWIKKISLIFSWFLGNNDRQEVLYDYITGGCDDGLTASLSNQNQGAESTLCWLWSLHRMIRIRQELQLKK